MTELAGRRELKQETQLSGFSDKVGQVRFTTQGARGGSTMWQLHGLQPQAWVPSQLSLADLIAQCWARLPSIPHFWS
jgi:hypothetical protein